MTPKQYFRQMHSLLISLDFVEDFQIREVSATEDFGYQRLRLNLVGGNMVEMFEYVVREHGRLSTLNYSFHLQAADGTLIKRWDNAPHYPWLKNFPHHLHDGMRNQVLPSVAMTGRKFLKELKRIHGR
ncbi:MAG: hypothetical protein D9V47_01440 [Clostridia bacterium]|nr:MAG: hypothetical protein D9V47_01440 [Clostridia bacterium]